MMNYIWAGLVLIGVATAFFTGEFTAVSEASLSAAKTAVQVVLALMGVMALWLGLMKIAEQSGLMDAFARMIRPLINLLFPELKKNKKAKGAITMNVAANALGLANAATPFGLKAMEEMQKDNKHKDTATNAMCTFLTINTAGIQLIPMSVIGILVGLGVKNPAEIIAPCLIVTVLTQVIAVLTVKMLQKWGKK